ncbi:Hpt domain-containing protein [Pseudomonas sp. LS1212]|uniref:hybrid sensor histidine kinase/response regulator n=1 Tax=Pseudomonas sp. LS1212 TaxID=2972478 RepID=UPI00215D001E|nr:Hpt domain-containing protein [Pseudomonas sp. LS1212]UVJ43761.1 Hpt domain-containing protein [Pseudomonas sp. LS1212]
MADRHDYVALEWVKGEIAETLKLARQGLEAYAADAQAPDGIGQCLDFLHQVHGSLQIVEFYGAALLAEEMEKLAQALSHGKVSRQAEAMRWLLKAMVQLPDYLEQVQSARRDLPLVVLPLLNELRSARGEIPLSQASLFSLTMLTPSDSGASQLAEMGPPPLLVQPTVVDDEHARLQGPDRDAMRSVLAALCEELVRVKEHLDLFVRSDRQHTGELVNLLPPLRQIADTLAVLGFGQPRKVIIDQLAVVQGLAQGHREPSDSVLMDVAGALLYVEATLAGMVGLSEQASREQSQLPTTDMTLIYQLVIKEARFGLQQAKDLIVDYIDSGWDRQRLLPLPELLTQIRGALAMIPLHRAAALLRTCNDYIQAHLLTGKGRPAGAELESLADAITGIEYYLERLSDDPESSGEQVLDVAEQGLADLGYEPVELEIPIQRQRDDVDLLAARAHALAKGEPLAPAALAQAPAAKGAIDPQLLEIFRNEALGHLASLDRYLHVTPAQLPLMVSDPLQRALHTLKGSAYMAGVLPIAELATALDRLAREFKAHMIAFESEEISLLQAAELLLRQGLGQLSSDPLTPIDGASALIERIEQRVASRLDALLNAPSSSLRLKRDPQLIAGFLAQGMDILLDADSLLRRWQQHPGERQELTALLDELTTLGEAAHLADLAQVDELCEGLLDLYGAVEESSLAVSERFFHEAESAHEALIDMLDQLAAGQEVDARPDRVNALRDLLEEGLHPSATGLIQRNGEQAVTITELSTATAGLAGGDVSSAEINDEIVSIFLEEAVDILENAGQALQRWLLDPDNAVPLSALQRDLHTLKGGARMAEIGPVGDLGHELESLYEGLVDRRYSHSGELAHLLRNSHDRLAQMLDQLQNRQPLSEPAALIEAIRAFRQGDNQSPPAQARPPASGAGPAASESGGSSSDNELLDIFLEEGFEIVESAGAALLRWQAEPRNSLEVENLLRDLHTLKGGARMVEIAPIGDLAHELEFLYESLSAGRLQPSAELFSLLQNCHDRLAHMLDAVRLRQPVIAATALIDCIRSFSSPAASEAQPLAEPAPAAQDSAAAPERGQTDIVKVAADLLDDLGNLAGETSIFRGRIEQQVNDAQVVLNEMETTIERMRDQLRRLDTETQGRILSHQRVDAERLGYEEFDPLEMDRHSQLQQLSRALFESASDLLDLKETLAARSQEAQALLAQQARVNTQLQEGLMRTRMVPFGRLVPRLQRIVRQVSSELGKQVEFVVGNVEGEIDRSVLERMIAPLEHMLRNAVDHGLESSEVRLAAGKPEQGLITLNLLHEGADIVVEMTDDGAGVPLQAVRRKAIERGLLDPSVEISDYDVMQFILQPGFSTAPKITQISGRGVGMDVVAEEVKQLGGSMVIDSVPGKGARFLIRLPFTVSVNRALMVQCSEEQYAIPLNTIEGIVRVLPAELEGYYQLDPPRYEYAGNSYELRYLGELLQGTRQPGLLGQSLPLPVLLVHSHDQQFAVQVDAVAGSREIVVKSLGPQFAAVQGLSGATILGDGGVVLILDLLAQIRVHQARHGAQVLSRGESVPTRVADLEQPRPLLVLVVDDSVTVRKVTSRLLERHGMNVLTAKDGVDAMALLQEHIPDILLLDIEMPRMDGFEVAAQVRRDARLKDLPIIMITSRTGQKHRDRAMAVGVNDYLGKPYQESVLLESIAQWSRSHA